VTKSVIIDTGIVVALIDKRDKWHVWANDEADKLFPPFLTSEAVITEASYLLRNAANGQQQLLSFVEEGFLQISFSLQTEIKTIQRLMNKYKDVPMDFADACLVRMSELIENSVVFTLDSDFLIYRKNGRKTIPLIFPHRN
jgi:predicted nucleic acid-binding protein